MVLCLTAQDVLTPLKIRHYLVQPPTISERICLAEENNHVCYLQKFPATLKLEDKWMVYDFNCLLTPSSVRI